MNILEFFNSTSLNESSSTEAALSEIFLRNASFSTLFISMMFYWTQTAFSSMKKTALPFLKVVNNEKAEFNQGGVFLPGQRSSDLSSEKYLLLDRSKNASTQLGEQSKDFFQSIVGRKMLNFALFRSFFMPKFLFKSSTSLQRKSSFFGDFKLTNFGTITMILSNFLLMGLLIVRWKESGHFPLSNLYESLMFLSWSCTCIHLILDQIVKTDIVRLDATLLTKLIGSITSPSALFTNAFATFSLPPEMQKASPLVPALQSNWLMMHVTVMIISYSALILGSLLSIAFLILISAKPSSSSLKKPGFFSFLERSVLEGGTLVTKEDLFCEPTESEEKDPLQLSLAVSGGSLNPTGLMILPVLSEKKGKDQFQDLQKQPLLNFENQKQEILIFQKTKNDLAWNFDNLSYRVLGIGFPFLTIGILSGAVWANEAWGSYWSWDPKETWALLTWLIYAIYLHLRITKGWQGKKPAMVASFGFVAIWFCFLGVNLIGEGLHSYGWFSVS